MTYHYRHVNKKHLDCVGKSWVDCKVCGYYLPTATSLASHVLNLHPKYHKKVQASMEPMQPKRYLECSCDFCDSQYYSRFASNANVVILCFHPRCHVLVLLSSFAKFYQLTLIGTDYVIT